MFLHSGGLFIYSNQSITTKKPNNMAVFKEREIKNMLDHLNGGAISLSRFTEILNKDAYISLKNKGEWVSMVQVVDTLEAFLAQNDTCKNETEIKIKSLIDYMKSQIIEACMQNLKTK